MQVCIKCGKEGIIGSDSVTCCDCLIEEYKERKLKRRNNILFYNIALPPVIYFGTTYLLSKVLPLTDYTFQIIFFLFYYPLLLAFVLKDAYRFIKISNLIIELETQLKEKETKLLNNEQT